MDQADDDALVVVLAGVAQQLADKNGLRDGMSAEDAADVIFALHSLELYYLLTQARGWTPARWESWLTETLHAAVLR